MTFPSESVNSVRRFPKWNTPQDARPTCAKPLKIKACASAPLCATHKEKRTGATGAPPPHPPCSGRGQMPRIGPLSAGATSGPTHGDAGRLSPPYSLPETRTGAQTDGETTNATQRLETPVMRLWEN